MVPRKFRRVLDLAHEGHQGIVKTKERLRSKVWWPGIEKKVQRMSWLPDGIKACPTSAH